MAVAFDVATESHTGTTGNASAASFTWNHTGGASAKGALVFVFSIGALTDTSVTYGGTTMLAVPYTAADTDTELGSVRAYYLDNCGTGTKAVVVNRTNNAVVMYAVAYTVTAAGPTEVYQQGVKTKSGSTAIATAASSTGTGTGTLAEDTVTDGSPGTNSLRFMGRYQGTSNVTAAGANSTAPASAAGSIDFGLFVIDTFYETTAGQGARNVGGATITDDVAAILLAVREIPLAGVGSATVTSLQPLAHVATMGGVASATGTALQPTGRGEKAAPAEVASATGTSQQPAVQIRATAGVASATGTAQQSGALGEKLAPAGLATAVGLAAGYTSLHTFSFAASAESWVGTSSVSSTLTWDGTVGDPVGSLKTDYAGSGVAQLPHWEWSGTWEDLGVTAGSLVQAIGLSADHYRIDSTGKGQVGSGPVELYDSTPTLIGVLRPVVYHEVPGVGWTTTGPWPSLSVPSAQQASNSSIRLRIASELAPDTSLTATIWQDGLAFVVEQETTASVGVQAGVAAASGHNGAVAQPPTAEIDTHEQAHTPSDGGWVTGAAHDAAVQSSANAEAASATGTAQQPSGRAEALAATGLGSATGTAQQPSARGEAIAAAELTSATGTAQAPTVSTGANAQAAAAIAAAYDPTGAVAVMAGLASAVGTAWDATITTGTGTTVDAEDAGATGTAWDATVTTTQAAAGNTGPGGRRWLVPIKRLEEDDEELARIIALLLD